MLLDSSRCSLVFSGCSWEYFAQTARVPSGQSTNDPTRQQRCCLRDSNVVGHRTRFVRALTRRRLRRLCKTLSRASRNAPGASRTIQEHPEISRSIPKYSGASRSAQEPPIHSRKSNLYKIQPKTVQKYQKGGRCKKRTINCKCMRCHMFWNSPRLILVNVT